jgi:hypothetical protein
MTTVGKGRVFAAAPPSACDPQLPGLCGNQPNTDTSRSHFHANLGLTLPRVVQAKLKEEYERMEMKLRAMESRLGAAHTDSESESRDEDYASPRSLNGSSLR